MTGAGANQANGPTVYIALGANLPFGELAGPALLRAALDRMVSEGIKVLAVSSFWETAPWPAQLAGQPMYVNAVAAIDARGLSPEALFALLMRIEAAFGRERRRRWAPRTLDLDVLDFGGQVARSPDLELPHPRLAERAFVLVPLAEAAPAWRHPVSGLGVAELLELLEEKHPGAARAMRRLSH